MDLACSVGFDDRERAAFGVKSELPTAFVREVMMSAAEWEEIAYVGTTTVSPVTDVVRRAMLEADAATTYGARLVQHPQCPPLMRRSQTLRATKIKDHAVRAEHGRNDVGETRHPTNGLHRKADATIRFNSGLRMRPVQQRLEIDDDGQIRPPRPATSAFGEMDKRECAQVIVLTLIQRARIGDTIMKQGLRCVADAADQPGAGLRIKLTPDTHHAALRIGPEA